MKAVADTGQIAQEPAWSLLLDDELEIAAAGEHWRRLTTEMRERDTLSATNTHALQRLVIAYILYDRSAREVTANGAVMKPKRGNPRAIARLSPHFQAMREAASDAEGLEAELGIAPRRRNSAGKVAKNGRKSTASAAFLKSVG